MATSIENKLHFVVTTTADDLEDDFNVHSPLRVIKQRAVHLVGTGAESANFRLEYNGEILTDEDRTIGDYANQFGWSREQTIYLELVPAPEVI